MSDASRGVIFGRPTVAQDIELPWPHVETTKTIWRNGIGMPVELLPPNYKELLTRLQ